MRRQTSLSLPLPLLVTPVPCTRVPLCPTDKAPVYYYLAIYGTPAGDRGLDEAAATVATVLGVPVVMVMAPSSEPTTATTNAAAPPPNALLLSPAPLPSGEPEKATAPGPRASGCGPTASLLGAGTAKPTLTGTPSQMAVVGRGAGVANSAKPAGAGSKDLGFAAVDSVSAASAPCQLT